MITYQRKGRLIAESRPIAHQKMSRVPAQIAQAEADQRGVAGEEGGAEEHAPAGDPDAPAAAVGVEQHGQAQPDEQHGVKEGDGQGGPINEDYRSCAVRKRPGPATGRVHPGLCICPSSSQSRDGRAG